VPRSLGAGLRIRKYEKIEGRNRPENLLLCTYCHPVFPEGTNPALLSPEILPREVLEWCSSQLTRGLEARELVR